jgi:aldehyde:ferredoxin oxidoreductase
MSRLEFRLLEVDLTRRETSDRTVAAELVHDFLGGASLAARLLLTELVPTLDPLSPEAPLLFLTGPLTGTAGPSVGRFVICGRSPATGFWAESNAGGFFGPELRMTGWDGLFIRGRAAEPLYLWIQDGTLEFRPADHLWGSADTYKRRPGSSRSWANAGARRLHRSRRRAGILSRWCSATTGVPSGGPGWVP